MASVRIMIVLLVGEIASLPAFSEWPHWRGPDRNGVVADSSGWDQGAWPPKEAWRASVGQGSTSPLIVSGRLYAIGWEEGRDRVVCMDAGTGKRLWTQQYDCPRYGRLATGDQGIYSGPSSTPEFDEQTAYLFTLSTDGDLNCWDTRSGGKNVWSKNLHQEFDVPQRPKVGRSGRRDYGYTSSPLVWHDWLIVEVGAREGNLVAFDKRTGKMQWASRSSSTAGHNGGPVPITVEGVPCVAIQNHDGLLVARLDPGHEGETIATVDWITSFANNIASAAVFEDSVLLTSAYNQNKIAKYRITLRGAEKLWEQKQASKVCTPVVHEGNVYVAWRNLYCLDFATGKLRWQGGRCGDQGSIIATADDRLIAWTNRGDLILAESAVRSPQRYTELATHKILAQSDAWPHIVLNDEKLYCRDRNGTIVCLRIGPG